MEKISTKQGKTAGTGNAADGATPAFSAEEKLSKKETPIQITSTLSKEAKKKKEEAEKKKKRAAAKAYRDKYFAYYDDVKTKVSEDW